MMCTPVPAEDPDDAVTDTGSSEEENPGSRDLYHDVYLRTVKPADIYSYMDTIECDTTSTNEALLRWFGVAERQPDRDHYRIKPDRHRDYYGGSCLSDLQRILHLSERKNGAVGLLASVGATKKQLERSMLSEALFVSLVGIPAG